MSPENPLAPPAGFDEVLEFQEVNEWALEGGREYVVIDHLEDFDPFLLSLVSTGEQWFFCSSHGSLSAGRNSAQTALFPYLTVDKIHHNWNVTGPQTAIACDGITWHPFKPVSTHSMPIHRKLFKSVLGEELIFEESHLDLGLRFRYHWQTSEKFGFVRKVQIINEGECQRSVRLIDGLDDLQVSGIGSRLHLELSCLADAYKLSELGDRQRLMVHRLASGLVDAPIPLESLKATTMWSCGFEGAEVYLSSKAAEEFLTSGSCEKRVRRIRGERGAYYLGGEVTLAKGESEKWIMVAEIEQNHEDVAQLICGLQDQNKLLEELEQDLEQTRERLTELAGSVDGLQVSNDRDVTLYHYHNVLCNYLRGGLPEQGSLLKKTQYAIFLEQNNRSLLVEHEQWFGALPESIERYQLLQLAEETGDSDLYRLTEEYLPLILARRHGDPSRPWNKFNIRLTDSQGHPMHHYEGNWRDIFQNWEALAWSYPSFLDGFISRFLNASTIDGFNPYRVTSSGIDWEVPDENDPWVSIGYWGDHQIIYLLKFLELKKMIDPSGLRSELSECRYVFADVPYVLDSWEQTLKDPRHTVSFDPLRHERLLKLREEIGADGLLLRDQEGALIKANLLEKLLIPALAKIGQLVPDGGIWMSNQKPEWNDANNALAGTGLSVVTAAYLLRYFKFLDSLIGDDQRSTYSCSKALASVVERVIESLGDDRWRKSFKRSGRDRFELARSNFKALETYRAEATLPESREESSLSRDHLRKLCRLAIDVLQVVLEVNRRGDGLWHSYNILKIELIDEEMRIQNLQLMLEGQVAILSSGFLDHHEALGLLESLEGSELRSSRHPTYLLYPDRDYPSFEEINLVDHQAILAIDFLSEMVKQDDRRLVYQDSTGAWRFADSLVNSYALAVQLDQLEGLSNEQREQIENLYEVVFDHQSFTGRSGSMFGYEGLGCVYWHMVSKLMLAAQEVSLKILEQTCEDDLKRRAIAAYYKIQRGLGFRQTAKQYGAFPAEPYSHSQGDRGAQQPGLTGQVKEGILCRLGELGVQFEDGCLCFRPRLLRKAEFRQGKVSFTHARTPVTYQLGEREAGSISVFMNDGSQRDFSAGKLDVATSRAVLFEEGTVSNIVVHQGTNDLI